jgi:hypothetical protein
MPSSWGCNPTSPSSTRTTSFGSSSNSLRPPISTRSRWPARQLAGLIDRWKNRGWDAAQVDAGESEAYANGKGAELYARYQERLKALNACDFGDLLLHMLVILKTHRDVLELISSASNISSSTNIRTPTRAISLAPPARAGAQEHLLRRRRRSSIYSGAAPRVANILRFEQDFPGREDHPPRAELPLDAAHPRRRLGRDRAE